MTYTPDVTSLWAASRIGALDVTQWPAYGTLDWHLMPVTHPARYAAVLEAAEQWRQAQRELARLDRLAETDPEMWWVEITEDAETEARRMCRLLRLSTSEPWDAIRKRRATHGPIHQLQATPGWPPIAIPGQPGRWLAYQEAA